MHYLFFDTECCDGNHICSFGYIIVDSNFNKIEKKDIVINPEKPFKLGRDRFDPRIQLAYQEETFYKQKNFCFFYNTIKELLLNKNYVILGHSITADIQYLKIACNRYNLKEFDVKIYDTQDFYYQLNKKYKSRSLENIIKDLSIDTENLQEHKSCDDAEMSMLVTKEICNQLDITIDDLLSLCESSIRDKNTLKTTKSLSKELSKIYQEYPNRTDWKSICFSDTFEKNYEKTINLIKKIFEKEYNYTQKVSECDFFVMGKTSGKRDLYCNHNIENCGKNIKKITMNDLLSMLDEKANNNDKSQTKDKLTSSNIGSKFCSALAQKGISYDEYIKLIDDNFSTQ